MASETPPQRWRQLKCSGSKRLKLLKHKIYVKQEFLTIMRSNWFKCKLLESARHAHTAAGLALS